MTVTGDPVTPQARNEDGSTTLKPAVIDFGGDRSDWIASLVVGGAAGLFLACFAVFAPHGDISPWSLSLVGVLAALVGWGAGIVATPYNKDETGRIGQIVTAIVAFFSGYIVSALNFSVSDRSISLSGLNDFINSPLVTEGALFIACFLNAFIITYIQRTYTWSNRPEL